MKENQLCETITENQTGINRNVEFVVVDHLEGLGHGVELIHCDSGDDYRPTAFIEGFSWLHAPGKELIKVRIISFASIPIEDKSKCKTIVEEIKDAVRIFFSKTNPPLNGNITDQIKIHLNG